MANIANLITKLTGIIASLDDIRDAISQGGGGSSTASGVSVTPTSPLTGTNLQATTNETATLLQDHTDEISTLNSSKAPLSPYSANDSILTSTTTYPFTYTVASNGFLNVQRMIATTSGVLLTINNKIVASASANAESFGLMFPVKTGDVLVFSNLSTTSRAQLLVD